MEYKELREKMAQRIFAIRFVKKAHFQIEDCRYMVLSFCDLVEPFFAINTDLYEALERLVKQTRPYAYSGMLDEADKALAKAKGGK